MRLGGNARVCLHGSIGTVVTLDNCVLFRTGTVSSYVVPQHIVQPSPNSDWGLWAQHQQSYTLCDVK